jgi:hypothetical protein
MYKTAPFIFSILLVLTGCSKGLSASDEKVCNEIKEGNFFKFKELEQYVIDKFGSIDRCFQLTECSKFFYQLEAGSYGANANKAYPTIDNPDLKEAMKFIADLQWPGDSAGIQSTRILASQKVLAIKTICDQFN